MSEASVRPGFALRGAALAEHRSALAASQSLDRERRIRRLLTVGGGWAVAGFMTIVAGGCLAVMWERPVPQDRLFVSILHSDGTYEPPVAREDLPRTRREVVLRYSLVQYVIARENYSWESVNGLYLRASAMSAPDERERYQKMMLDKKNPDNPSVLYGDGLNAGIADVQKVIIKTDPATPNSVEAVFLVKVTAPGTQAKTYRKTARINWMEDGRIPIDVQQRYDPAGISILNYSSALDLDSAK